MMRRTSLRTKQVPSARAKRNQKRRLVVEETVARPINTLKKKKDDANKSKPLTKATKKKNNRVDSDSSWSESKENNRRKGICK